MPPRSISSIFRPTTRNDLNTTQLKVLPPARFIASSPDGKGYIGLSRERYSERRSAPSKTFDSCTKPSLLQGWRDSLGMFRDWIFNRGESSRVLESCSLQSQNMADAPAVEKARQLLYEKNEGRLFEDWVPVTNYRGSFGVPGLIAAGVDPTEQFVGSYKVEIFPQRDQTLRFELTNTTSLESFLYGLGPEYERDSRPYGGNMRQKYTWIEPVEISPSGD